MNNPEVGQVYRFVGDTMYSKYTPVVGQRATVVNVQPETIVVSWEDPSIITDWSGWNAWSRAYFAGAGSFVLESDVAIDWSDILELQ